MDIITKINTVIEKEIDFAKEISPKMGVSMMFIKDSINNLEEVKDKNLISDGFHTFGELYYHRMVLFSVICKVFKEKAWKSWKHDDGTMYDGYFIVGITTDEGEFTYHYKKEFWDRFDVKELEYAPKWDGVKSVENIERLRSLI